MPVSASQDQIDLNELTNEEIRVLFQIIEAADRLPDVETHPFRAIHTAYEQVLRQHGSDPTHDRVYLRSLFRLKLRRDDNQSLLGCFQQNLADNGIFLEIGDNDEEQEFGNDDLEEVWPAQEETAEHVVGEIPGQRSRRASLGSFHEIDRVFNRYPPRRSESDVSLQRRTDVGAKPSQQQPASGSENKDLRHIPISAPFPQHVAFEQSLGKNRRYYNGGSVGNAIDNQENPEDLHVEAAQSYLPSETQLIRDAQTFADFRAKSQLLQKWQSVTAKVRHLRQNVYQNAVRHDSLILTRQAFQTWKDLVSQKKELREVEEHLQSLHDRAILTYKTTLLKKATTHWAGIAIDHIEQAALAQRYMIRFKFFHDWKQYSVLNELKTKQIIERKFFVQWQSRARKFQERNAHSNSTYHLINTERIFRNWYWSVCAQWATERRDMTIKGRSTTLWFRGLTMKSSDREAAHTFRRKKIIENTMKHIHANSVLLEVLQNKANNYQHNRLKAAFFLKWQTSTNYKLPSLQVRAMVDWRIVATTFFSLLAQYNRQMLSKSVDEKRLTRIAWCRWNDRLRWQTLTKRIDDRFLVQALYKWVLAERFKLLKRLHEERLERRSLTALLKHHHNTEKHRAAALDKMKALQKHRTMATILEAWHRKLDYRKQILANVAALATAQTQQKYLQQWAVERKKLQLSVKSAKDACFFFRASRTLRVLQSVRTSIIKQKQRSAYILFRRRVKTKVAQVAFDKWSQRTQHRILVSQAGSEVDQQRILSFSAELFDRWLKKLMLLRDAETQIRGLSERCILQICIQQWRDYWSAIQETNRTSDGINRTRGEKAAIMSLRALQLKALKNRTQVNEALALSHWKQRRYLVDLLQNWRGRTMRKKGYAEEDIPQTARTRRTGIRNAMERMESADGTLIAADEGRDWKQFPAGDLDLTRLSTPSKRGSRRLGGQPSTPASLMRLGVPLQRQVPVTSATESRLARSMEFARSISTVRRSLFDTAPDTSTTESTKSRR